MSDMDEIKSYIDFVKSNIGLDLSSSDKIQIEKRIKNIKSHFKNQFDDLNTILNASKADHLVREILINLSTNNETAFFRDKPVFELLDSLIKERKYSSLNILSLPCSTGQEAYSIAFLLQENGIYNYNILCSDIDTEVIKKAENGIYNKFEIMRGLSDDHKEKLFEEENGMWKVKSSIQKNLSFKKNNILNNPLDNKFDIIFFRNLLIYFDDYDRDKALRNIESMLNSGGVVILGNGETCQIDSLEENDFQGVRYYIKK